ncbi:MAG: ribosome biogenesis GTPase Der [Kiritimatiellia bacterium]|nr:ribosome biogenesis GTPase Der [Kiritimatiellia bacterium]
MPEPRKRNRRPDGPAPGPAAIPEGVAGLEAAPVETISGSSGGEGLPRAIAIVGRPNVGKSALFNRLVGRRLAIVHEEEGVTRDRLVGEGRWNDRAVEFIDTGGIGMLDRSSPANDMAAATLRQTELAIEEAALIVMVVDCTAGLTPLDEDVARRLHRSGRWVLVAANKADHPGLDTAAGDFERLGFPVHPVSALHNRGIRDLMDVALTRLPPPADPTAVEPVRVVVVGRPNAGKSSFINRLIGKDRLIVSEIPGTTRDSIEIPFSLPTGEGVRHYRLVDTAGIRPHARSRTAIDSFSLLRVRDSVSRADVVVLMLDAVEGPRRQDKKIVDLVAEFHKGCVVLVNKWDLARSVSPKAYRDALYAELPFLRHIPVLFLSARTGYQVPTALAAVDRVAAAVSTKLSTGLLNRVLREAIEAIRPPSTSGRRMKLYYVTQTGTKPLRIRAFVNDPALAPPAYERYLIQNLRRAFDLPGAPLLFDWKSRAGYRGK